MGTRRYTNKPVVRHGLKFDSGTEADRYDELLLEQKAGAIRNLEADKSKLHYVFKHDGVEFARYTPDFRYERRMHCSDIFGSWVEWDPVVEDHKGWQSAEDTAYKMRLRMMRVFYGIEVFESGIDRQKIRDRKRRKREKKATAAKISRIAKIEPCPHRCDCSGRCVYGSTLKHDRHLCETHFLSRVRAQGGRR